MVDVSSLNLAVPLPRYRLFLRDLSELAQSTHQMFVKLVQTGNDYTVRQFAVMVCCKKAPMTVRNLAAELNVSRPVISRVADRLDELKFIRRIDDPEDRRSVLIELTAHGRKFIDSIT